MQRWLAGLVKPGSEKDKEKLAAEQLASMLFAQLQGDCFEARDCWVMAEAAQLLAKKAAAVAAEMDATAADAADPAVMRLAAAKGDVPTVAKQLRAGLAVDTVDDGGETALMEAAKGGHLRLVKYLLSWGANVEAKNKYGHTPLMQAASSGHLEIVKLLVEEHHADKTVKCSRRLDDKTAADWAMGNNHPMVAAYLDPEAAQAKGEALKNEIATADRVHVISTRFRKDRSQVALDAKSGRPVYEQSCDPFKTAYYLKRAIDKTKGVVAYDPNGTNAYLTAGKGSDRPQAVWLLNWRQALSRAKETGGCCVQIVVKPGLSDMQRAEASMAADKGVRVCTPHWGGLEHAPPCM